MSIYGAVIIATYNRANELKQCIEHMEKSTVFPKRIIIIDASSEKVEFSYHGKLNIDYHHVTQTGLTVQRNIGIDMLEPQTEIVTFLDDDMYVDAHYFENLYVAFQENEEMIGAEGALRIDGGRRLEIPKCNLPLKTLYGCNMSFRYSAIAHERFDENLKLYAFKEDWDFSYRLACKGKYLKLYKCTGEHEISPKRAVNDEKMGYMWVANDCYIKRKNRIFSVACIFYYLAYMARHLLCFWKTSSRKRLKGALRAFWKVVILSGKP